ncbi:MAG: methyltransferase domain-containing protein [Desulfuromusa sp.]|nr:methyltransferase domain-containing protein [Desulfuromusa sp.]
MLKKIINCLRSIGATSFSQLSKQEYIYLYAGDVGTHTKNGPVPFIGMSLNKSDRRHIKHDVRQAIPLPDNSVSIYQSEDVFEHLEYNEVLAIVNEVFRVLQPGGLFRFSLPDYRCDVLESRSLKDKEGKIAFDPGGGGRLYKGRVVDGGHLWFPTYESVAAVMNQSDFAIHGKINFLHYYDKDSNSITKKIDHSKGIISRTPDYDERVQAPRRAMSIVIDAHKNAI